MDSPTPTSPDRTRPKVVQVQERRSAFARLRPSPIESAKVAGALARANTLAGAGWLGDLLERSSTSISDADLKDQMGPPRQ